MIKKLIAPLQKVLLDKKFCPACTRPLTRAKVRRSVDGGSLVMCQCNRVFVFNELTQTYRRALEDELQAS